MDLTNKKFFAIIILKVNVLNEGRMKMKKYFVSYVIPAYNCKDTLGMTLASIAMQQFKHEIQVVIADDCSTEDYTSIINKYKDDVDISLVRLEKNSGPGVARQLGIDNSNSEYVSFVDADDQLTFDAYVNVREVLMQQHPDMLITNFLEQSGDLKTYVPHTRDTVWVHGKYFKKSFLDENEIRCHETLRTHEDIYFNHLVLNTTDNVMGVDFATYIWNFKPDSLTRRLYNGCHTYVEQCLPDYVEATIAPCRKLIAQNPSKYKEKVKDLMVLHPLYLYFYIQSFKYEHPYEWYKHNLLEVTKVLKLIEENYHMTYKEIVHYISERKGVYSMIRQACERGVGDFMEQESFYSFLEVCSKLELK